MPNTVLSETVLVAVGLVSSLQLFHKTIYRIHCTVYMIWIKVQSITKECSVRQIGFATAK
jgi:hypothetical protein